MPKINTSVTAGEDGSEKFSASMTGNPNGYIWADPSKYMGDTGSAETTASFRPASQYSQSLVMPPTVGIGRFAAAIVSGDLNIVGNIYAGIDDKNAKIITNPKLIVLNNQEASIDIIEEVPYIENQTTTPVSQGNATTTTTSFKEVGLKMKVRPQINRDGTIVLEVSPEQSFRTGETVNGVPVLNTSKAKTIMILRSGETAIIGGLIREAETKTETKVPLLGDIPIIGYLFKNVSKNKERHELTVFISAKIIN
jgi:type II secretory pathway component GspD/PulD (secretin)